MSDYNPLGGNRSFVDADTEKVRLLQSMTALLTLIGNTTSSTSTNTSGLATETTLATIQSIVSTNGSYLMRDSWALIPNNSVEYNYYIGVAPGNPSGSTDNVETAVYKTGATTVFTQTFEYNAANNVVKITVS